MIEPLTGYRHFLSMGSNLWTSDVVYEYDGFIMTAVDVPFGTK